MAISIVMPALELAQETGKLVAWRKNEGESVAKGEPLLEIETDKAVVEIESPGDRILSAISAKPGDTVPVGVTIAWLLQPGESAPASPASSPASGRASTRPVTLASPAKNADPKSPGPVKISPKARRLAQEREVNLQHLRGSGTGGEILASDILAAAEALTTVDSAAAAESGGAALSSVARLMAERTTQSWTSIPHFFVAREIDAGALNEFRERIAPEIEKAHGVRPTHTDLLIALVARVLAQHPRLNSRWTGNSILDYSEINIGVAIAVEEGVVAAVIRNANKSTLGEIATQRNALSQRARGGRLRPADIAGATFTISNLGMYGVDAFTAIISPSQAAILAVGRIADRVVAIDGRPAIRPMATFTLSCDHRVVDGARREVSRRDRYSRPQSGGVYRMNAHGEQRLLQFVAIRMAYMIFTRAIALTFLMALVATLARAQQYSGASTIAFKSPQVLSLKLSHRAAPQSSTQSSSIALSVPKGSAIQVALAGEVRLRKVGQPVQGRVVEPVYAFDKLVVPVGSKITGHITKIERVPAGRRTAAAMDTDFSPTRKVELTFDELALADGRRVPVHTSVTPGSGQVIQFVTADDKRSKKSVKDEASAKARQAKAQARSAWDDAMKQIKEPGKIRRLERYAFARLPIHPQYIDAGTIYFAELDEPLDFGSERLPPEKASTIGVLRETSFVRATLETPLDSATTPAGAEVDAVLSQPLFDGDRLILPQGSHLKGSVVQAARARYMSRNGRLRIVFHQVDLPDGVHEKVVASLEGIQAGKQQGVKLDSEGGAEATSSKSRYALTAVSAGLAAVSFGGDRDALGGNPAGNTSNRIAGGARGFKLIGIVLGASVHSRIFGATMGAYGAGMSVYAHFIARGHDVVFPKNTAMQVSIAAVPAAKARQMSPDSE